MNDDEYEDMAIRVVVRKRPISRQELAKGDRDVMEIKNKQVLLHEPKTKVDLTKVIETQLFRFDDAFGEIESNELIYNRTVRHLVASVFEGGKASCFAYGQTGSGKTFTMMGSNPAAPTQVSSNPGLYVLAARDLFELLGLPQHKSKGLAVYTSCFEIYGGKLFDLLNERASIRCLEDAHQKVQTPGLTEHRIHSVEALLELMAEAHTQRSTGSTGANMESSRSHQVLQICVRSAERPVPGKPRPAPGKLSFIDLAGSERGADTTHNNKQTRMEGADINTSLLALKEVIRSRERKKGHTPFRGSKLTQVLKDSFVGDNTRTCMIACVSPSHSNCEHTRNTLLYADRVKEHQHNGGHAISSSSSSSNSSDHGAGAHALPPRPGTSAGINGRPAPLPGRRASSHVSRPETAPGLVGSTRPPLSESLFPTPEEDRTQIEGESSVLQHQQQETQIAQQQEELLRLQRLQQQELERLQQQQQEQRQQLQQKQQQLQQQQQQQQHQEEDERKKEEDGEEMKAEPEEEGKVLEELEFPIPALSLSGASGEGGELESQVGAVEVAGAPSDTDRPSSVSLSAKQNYASDERPAGPSRRRASSAEVGAESADLIRRTVGLISAHKMAIAEMVEVMKDEMNLVQEMEDTERRDAENYTNTLEKLLLVKGEAISLLRAELQQFQSARATEM
jgi:kinesin family protein 2/24